MPKDREYKLNFNDSLKSKSVDYSGSLIVFFLESDQICIYNFVLRFVDPQSGNKCYLDGVAELVKPERNTLVVDFEHIGEFSGSLKSALELQFYRFDNSIFSV
jgi:hypothetical protein